MMKKGIFSLNVIYVAVTLTALNGARQRLLLTIEGGQVVERIIWVDR
jgi:hypothetical protein